MHSSGYLSLRNSSSIDVNLNETLHRNLFFRYFMKVPPLIGFCNFRIKPYDVPPTAGRPHRGESRSRTRSERSAASPALAMVETQVGGLVCSGPVCWLPGGRRAVIGFGKSLTAYVFTESGGLRPTASLHGHEGRVVAAVPVGTLRVASASTDGTVRVWGVEDGALLRTVDVGQPLLDLCSADDGRVVATSATEISILTLQRDGALVTERSRLLGGLPSSPRRRTASSSDASVVASIAGRELTLAFSAGDFTTCVTIRSKLSLSAVSLSPDGTRLALGTEAGIILVYRDIASLRRAGGGTHTLKQSAALYSKFHWHSQPVLSLRFSAAGNILYSGGCEGVLVVWKMTRTDFGQRNFKPRLPGAIWSVSPSDDESRVALTLADNSVLVLNTATLAVAASFHGIATAHLRKLPPWDVPRGSSSAASMMRLTAEPGNSGCALVSGMSNAVQLYNVARGAHVADLTVIPRNVVLAEDALAIRHVAVSVDKRFMASVTRDAHPLTETRVCPNAKYMETLKFWDYHGGSGRIDLLSRVEEPHGPVGEITAVAFHPTSSVLATASSSGSFKLWRPVSGQEHDVLWRCEFTGSYKNMPCTTLAFASDGSMLAVGFESSVTLWSLDDFAEDFAATPADSDAFNMKLVPSSTPCTLRVKFLHSLVHPPTEECIASVSFVSDNSPLLLAVTCNGVYVWDILERRIWWSSRIVNRPGCTVVDASCGRFALVVKLPGSHSAFTSQTTESSAGAENASVESKEAKKGSVQPKRQRTAPQGPTTDTAVAVFNSSSAVPLSVTRLPSGTNVSGIAFLPLSGPSSSVSSSLVCFDTNMEVVRVPAFAENDIWSSVTQSAENSEDALNASPNHLGELLGNTWRDFPADAPGGKNAQDAMLMDVPDKQSTLLPIHRTLDKYLAGPAGALPPSSAFALPLMKELVEIVQSSAPKTEITSAPADSAVKDVEMRDATPASQENNMQTRARKTDAKLSTMATFLKSILPPNP